MSGKVDYSYVEEYNGEDVKEDPNLTRKEKDVFIRLDHITGEAIVESNKASIIRRLLRHDEAKIKRLRKFEGYIVGGTFRVPIGCIKISKSSRATNNLSSVVGRG